jgi:hypothetical protein
MLHSAWQAASVSSLPEGRTMIGLVFALAVMQSSSGIVTVSEGSRSAIAEPREATARTAAEWQALWKQHGASEPAPAVDFTKEMVAAVFLGTRPTGGYAVEIRAARREGAALVIEYVEHAPGRDAIVTQALTSPFHIVRLPKYDGMVRFRRVSPSIR